MQLWDDLGFPIRSASVTDGKLAVHGGRARLIPGIRSDPVNQISSRRVITTYGFQKDQSLNSILVP